MEHFGPVPRQTPPEVGWDGRSVEATRGEALGLFGRDARRDETGSVCAEGGVPGRAMAENRMPRRRLRAAFLTPSLLLGGAERWLISLARASREAIEWTGTAMTERARAHGELLRELAGCMPVYAGVRRTVGRVAGLTLPVVYVAHGGSPRVIRSSEAGATHLAVDHRGLVLPRAGAGHPGRSDRLPIAEFAMDYKCRNR
jgi:hypothetical protein